MYADDDENMKRIRCALDEFPLAHTLVRCARTQRCEELKFAPRFIHPHNSVPTLPHNIAQNLAFLASISRSESAENCLASGSCWFIYNGGLRRVFWTFKKDDWVKKGMKIGKPGEKNVQQLSVEGRSKRDRPGELFLAVRMCCGWQKFFVRCLLRY